MVGARKVSASVLPLSAADSDFQLRRAMSRSKSADCSLAGGGGHVTAHRRPTTPVTYTSLLSWRRGRPEVYVVDRRDAAAGNSPPPPPLGHVTGDVRRPSANDAPRRSSGGKMAASDDTLTSVDRQSSAAAAEDGEIGRCGDAAVCRITLDTCYYTVS